MGNMLNFLVWKVRSIENECASLDSLFLTIPESFLLLGALAVYNMNFYGKGNWCGWLKQFQGDVREQEV